MSVWHCGELFIFEAMEILFLIRVTGFCALFMILTYFFVSLIHRNEQILYVFHLVKDFVTEKLL